MRSLAQAGEVEVFWATVGRELVPVVAEWLVRRRRLTVEDAEDCIQEALAGLADGHDLRGIGDPHGYVWRACKNAAASLIRDTVRDRDHRRDGVSLAADGPVMVAPRPDSPSRDGEATDDPPDDVPDVHVDLTADRALAVVESLVEDAEVTPDWAKAVVEWALTRMPAGERKIVQYLLSLDFDERWTAAAGLGLQPGAYRARKKRAFDRLRDLIPRAMTELGIPVTYLASPEVFDGSTPVEFPSPAEPDAPPAEST